MSQSELYEIWDRLGVHDTIDSGGLGRFEARLAGKLVILSLNW